MVDAKAKDNTQTDPLLAAAKANDLKRLRELLEARHDVNSRDKNGDTALHIAARAGYQEAFELLLNAHANPGALNQSGESIEDVIHNSHRPEMTAHLRTHLHRNRS